MFQKTKKVFLKGMSVFLASSIICTSATGHTNAISIKNISSNIISGAKKIYDEYSSTIYDAATVILAAILVYNIIFSNSSTTTIEKEIEKYINRAPEVFEIEESVIKETDPEILLRTLIQLNKLFDKYKGFTKELIKTKKSNRHSKKFTLRLLNESENTLASAYVNLAGINLTEKYYNKNNKYLINTKRSSYHSPYDDDKSVESVISHEFGHVMEFLYISKNTDIKWEDYDSHTTINEYFEYIADQKAEIIKNQIIEKANKKNICEDLGTYSKTNSYEFFAEAFATLQCSTDSQYKYIRNAVQKTISNWF